jgi:hypothetical protein
MRKRSLTGTVLGLAALAGGAAWGADAVMGDWEGTRAGAKLVAQVIAWGDGKYQANLLEAFDQRVPPLVVLHGQLQDNKVAFTGRADKGKLEDTEWTAAIEGEKFAGSYKGSAGGRFELKKTVRLSPTLGAKPPQGAVVLFDGTSTDGWQQRNGQPIRWKLDKEEKAMTVSGGGIISKRKFAGHKLHLEFATPFMPKARGQGRGNSGVYLQGRYEVQVLDSYGLEGRSNECGGIYGVGAPRVNMCAPPLQWQTYDITFWAPRFDADGKKTENPRMTVVHNGVTIHEKVEVPKPTTAHWGGDPKEPNGVHLQDHGNPVRYRNIWVVEFRGGEL